MEAGLDSLGAVELRNALSSRLAVDLPATLILDYPTISSLAEHLGALHGVARAAITGEDIQTSSLSYVGSYDMQASANVLYHDMRALANPAHIIV